MLPSMVGLLAAVATAMSALVGLAHGYLIWAIIALAAAAAGLVAYLPLSPKKKSKKIGGMSVPYDIGALGVSSKQLVSA